MSKYNLNDTIAAIATSIGESGIGIVRISGKDALAIADRIFLVKDKQKPSSFKTYTVHYGWIVEPGIKTEIIDEVILTIMRSPKSYTKEDVVEINCHGGIAVQNKVLELVLKEGARLAQPGEFTLRAFLNGRIDLVQAEAVLDIIRAKTSAALKLGLTQLQGKLSAKINRLRQDLLEVAALLEANIEFPDEELGKIDTKQLFNRLSGVRSKLKEILSSARQARIIRDGLHVVICGKPNVGKSSLLNALLKYERSIVTPVAGTTRDTVEETMDIKGIPVRIVDTAGIIEPTDIIGKKAISRSKRHIKEADLILLVFDGSRRLGKEDTLLIKRLKTKTVIAVINKIDLPQKIEIDKIKHFFRQVVMLSAKKSQNIESLEEAIARLVYAGELEVCGSVIMGNLRHIEMMRQAEKFIASACDSLDNMFSPEFVAEDIKVALLSLDEITGRRFNEDLLERIFSDFCVGK
ncbi:MAG: tRNA uridine-5-carboxymethylaminomethyl(34) synthesis GTPase MnmE [Candidatus Omnitrophica bacterium]|nr:tRNA uridine-5-carboxymethylaminomethyl(34) synthesis GTPase MnmE [Candidatus Omnitrophota bacterium]